MSGNRTPLVVGNWKMHKTAGEAVQFVHELLALAPDLAVVHVVIAPPFTALHAVHDALCPSAIELGAQTMNAAESGAFTGEISPLMLRDCGATWVILGHSERREGCGETDAGVNRKVRAALGNGITPIVAVGESATERGAGRATERVVAQTRAAFAGIGADDVARCVTAYEPLWAIGSGTSDTPDGANAIMGDIRGSVRGLERARLLYGGSVKPANIGAFVAQPDIDGALVGSASLDPHSFAALLAAAAARANA